MNSTAPLQKLCNVVVLGERHYFENQKEPTTEEANTVFGVKVQQGSTGSSSCWGAGSQALVSAHAHTHVHDVLPELPLSFFTQADFQELPFHTFVPPMDREMPQQSRSGELVHGE